MNGCRVPPGVRKYHWPAASVTVTEREPVNFGVESVVGTCFTASTAKPACFDWSTIRNV